MKVAGLLTVSGCSPRWRRMRPSNPKSCLLKQNEILPIHPRPRHFPCRRALCGQRIPATDSLPMKSVELLRATLGWLNSLSYALEDGDLKGEEGEQDELDALIVDIEKHLEDFTE